VERKLSAKNAPNFTDDNPPSKFNRSNDGDINIKDLNAEKAIHLLETHSDTEGDSVSNLSDKDGFTQGSDNDICLDDCTEITFDSFQNDGSLNSVTRAVTSAVHDLSNTSMAKFVTSRIESGMENASFFVTDLNAVVKQFRQWKEELPMVDPFYAVKCNPDPEILRLLASMGCNFDCATMGEIDLVLNGLGSNCFTEGFSPAHSIVYANPAKMPQMLQFAQSSGVRMTVFDGEDELYKIAAIQAKISNHKFQLLLRLATDDKASICRFSKKFGCPVDEAHRLLSIARSLNLDFAGVSFHVGSGCGDAGAYRTALQHTRRVFEEAASLGFPPLHIVDLGGGFPGDTGGYGGEGMPTFQQLALAIREELAVFQTLYGSNKVRFIAEPGRYFVSASTVIATKIYSRKGGRCEYQALYVDDGVYGSFNNVVYDHYIPIPQKLSTAVAAVKKPSSCGSVCELTDDESASGDSESEDDADRKSSGLIPSAVFGPTCDGLDQLCALETTMLPRCEVGEWLLWENMGAYTHTASYVFNGYTHVPQKTYCFVV